MKKIIYILSLVMLANSGFCQLHGGRNTITLINATTNVLVCFGFNGIVLAPGQLITLKESDVGDNNTWYTYLLGNEPFVGPVLNSYQFVYWPASSEVASWSTDNPNDIWEVQGDNKNQDYVDWQTWFCAGFGVGLTLLGFGWGMRLVNQIGRNSPDI